MVVVDDRARLRRLRRWLGCVLVVNLIVLLAGVGVWWELAWVGLQVHGAYRDLDARGAIDQRILADVAGNEVASDWGRVVSEFLLGDRWNHAFHLLYVLGGFAMLGIVLGCVALWTTRGAEA